MMKQGYECVQLTGKAHVALTWVKENSYPKVKDTLLNQISTKQSYIIGRNNEVKLGRYADKLGILIDKVYPKML